MLLIFISSSIFGFAINFIFLVVKQRSQRPASTLSGSSTKEPCENESSDASPYCISGMWSNETQCLPTFSFLCVVLHNFLKLLDDEGSRYPRFNDFGSSVPSYAGIMLKMISYFIVFNDVVNSNFYDNNMV